MTKISATFKRSHRQRKRRVHFVAGFEFVVILYLQIMQKAFPKFKTGEEHYTMPV